MSEVDNIALAVVIGILLGAGIVLHVLRMLAMERVARAAERLVPMIETAEHMKAVLNTQHCEFQELKQAQEILAFVSPALRLPIPRLFSRRAQK